MFKWFWTIFSLGAPDCLHHILKIKLDLVRQVLDGSLIELTTMEKLLLERQKGDSDRLIEVAAE